MPNAGQGRRAFLGSVGTLTVAGVAGRRLQSGTDHALGGAVQPDHSETSCTPGHAAGESACTQIRADRDVLTTFDATDTDLVTTFEYPCGWTTAIHRYDDRIQANVTRSGIGDVDAYVNVQVRNYTASVDDGFLDSKKAEGDYEEVEYEYDGNSRTGLVSSPETAQYGTTAHAVVPSHVDDRLVHVELVSTLKGVDCPQPQPDYLLVKEMLASLKPNHAAAGLPTATVTIADQQVSADVETQAVVIQRVSLSDGGFVSITPASVENGVDNVIGVSSYLSAEQHDNVRIALDTTLEDGQTITAVVHLDTDGDNFYEFGDSPGLDEPYTNQAGGPVHDRATIEVATDTPIPTDSFTQSPTPTATPTPKPDPPSPTPSPTRSPSPDPRPQTTSQSTTTGEDGPGFGFGAVVSGLGLASLLFVRRQLQDRTE